MRGERERLSFGDVSVTYFQAEAQRQWKCSNDKDVTEHDEHTETVPRLFSLVFEI